MHFNWTRLVLWSMKNIPLFSYTCLWAVVNWDHHPSCCEILCTKHVKGNTITSKFSCRKMELYEIRFQLKKKKTLKNTGKVTGYCQSGKVGTMINFIFVLLGLDGDAFHVALAMCGSSCNCNWFQCLHSQPTMSHTLVNDTIIFKKLYKKQF